MRSCPCCGSLLFEDMDRCYECMHPLPSRGSGSTRAGAGDADVSLREGLADVYGQEGLLLDLSELGDFSDLSIDEAAWKASESELQDASCPEPDSPSAPATAFVPDSVPAFVPDPAPDPATASVSDSAPNSVSEPALAAAAAAAAAVATAFVPDPVPAFVPYPAPESAPVPVPEPAHATVSVSVPDPASPVDSGLVPDPATSFASPSAAQVWSLTVEHPDGSVSVFDVGGEGSKMTMGRSGDNDIVIRDPRVSRHHAVVICSGGRLWIRDSGSVNMTFLEGFPVTGTMLVGDGARVAIGPATITARMSPRVRQAPSPG